MLLLQPRSSISSYHLCTLLSVTLRVASVTDLYTGLGPTQQQMVICANVLFCFVVQSR